MNIIIAERLALFREGLITMLGQEEGFTVVGEATSAGEMVSLALEHRPDVILMDCELGDGEGIEAMKTLQASLLETAFIVMFNDLTPDCFVDAVFHGARGVLRKTVSRQMMVSSLRAVDRGEAVIPRKLVGVLLDELVQLDRDHGKRHPSIEDLTYRECEVLNLLGANCTNREIASRLIISENTVRVHVHNILEKLNLQNRREAAAFAARHQLPSHNGHTSHQANGGQSNGTGGSWR